MFYKKIAYGGDYNPEQWDDNVRAEDMELLKKAGIDILTLNVFNWASLQKDDDVYDFSELDKVINMVTENGYYICLATSTGAHPAWMAKKHPDILRTEFNGMKRKFGGRHNSCPNSITYRKYSEKLAGMIAHRYKDNKNIVAYHVSNEYGGVCYCDNCEKAFRNWLKDKYKTIEKVNESWNTKFWGHTFYDFDEIVAPNLLSEHFEWDRTMFQGISLDYQRFSSDSLLDCYKLEYNAIKKEVPQIPITTNLMGFFKQLDYQKWAEYMDFVSWDNYPAVGEEICESAMKHDLMRSLKDGAPFALMEQTPSVTNWHPYNALKRPGVMRLLSYQAVAHGSDTIMFFQMRRSKGACEKYHGAVIDHAGTDNTRVYRECAALGEELYKLGDAVIDGRTHARAAILFDWDNWWAVEYSAGPSCDMKYYDEVLNYYKVFFDNNIPVDIISTKTDLSKYDLVVAPLLYMVKTGYDEKIREYVKLGKTFVTSYFSGIVDEHDLVTPGGYPGKLRDILGIWVEEQDALPNGNVNTFAYKDGEYSAKCICDIMHLEGAVELGRYTSDFYAETPVITVNQYGEGFAYYIGTRSDKEFYSRFFKEEIFERLNIQPVIVTGDGVEASKRENSNGEFIFLLNHSDKEEIIVSNSDYTNIINGTKYQNEQKIRIKAKDVMILKNEKVENNV